MRRRDAVLAVVVAAVAGVAFAQAGAGPDAADWAQIRRVVVEQREALVAGDDAKAYAYASPGIRAQYPTPAAFGAMVRRSYAALVEARVAQLLDGAVIAGDVIQPLQLVMPDDTVLVALYTMQRQRDGGWRIAGCLIAPSVRRSA
jgi:hypothetical protein